jgi:hypothetical protein
VVSACKNRGRAEREWKGMKEGSKEDGKEGKKNISKK